MSDGADRRLVGVAEVAGDSIRRIRAQVGLVAFALTFLLGLRNGTPLASLCVRAVIAGVVASTVAWAVAITVYRHLLRARVRAVVRARSRG